MRVWITKYALTRGIYSVDVVQVDDKMVKEHMRDHGYAYYHKPYWHETVAAAHEHAIKMMNRRRVSLQTEIRKLDLLIEKMKPQ
jgi:hypothetical protein